MKEKKPKGFWNYDTCKEEAQKYSTRRDFQKGSNGAYDAAWRNGWIKDFDWLVKPRIAHNKKWTREKCYEEAKKYTSRGDFYKYSGVAYGVALTNGWLEGYDWFEQIKRPNGYWNYDACKEEAKKYKTKADFRKFSSAAYSAALKKGWLNEYDWFEITRTPRGHWNHETCKEEAKKYKTRTEFCKGSNGAYEVAWRNGWLDEYEWFEIKWERKWDYDTCLIEAKKYMSRTEFCNGSVGAYTAALDNNWLDEYDWFDDIDDTFKTKRGHCVYVYIWETEMVAYVGLTHLKQRRHRDHSSEENSPVFRYSKDNQIPIPEPIYLEDKLTYDEAQKKEEFYINQYKGQGYEMLNSAAAGGLGGFGKGKWNYETCKKFASNYKTRSEFQKASMAAYNVALRNGWLDDYDWFEQKHKPIGYWTYDTCMEEAKKYKTKSEFKDGAKGAYQIARKNGWLDKYTWFISAIKWTYETCKEEAKKYKTKRDFQKGCIGAYTAALRNKWLDDYDWFEVLWEKKWNYDTCMEESRKYKSRSEFMKGTPGAYNIANKNRWLDEYEWLDFIKKPNGFWNYETCKNEALKYKTQTEFRSNNKGAYAAARANNWIHDYDWFEQKGKPKGYWNYDTCKEEARKYKSRTEFAKGSPGAHGVAQRNKWLDDYDWFESQFQWDYDSCKKEAQKYKSRNEFSKNSAGAYTVARKNGWLDEYDWFEKKKGIWTHETCFEEAQKYGSRGAFHKGCKGAYEVARINGWLDEYDWFEKKKGIWTYETCFEEAQKYNSQLEFKKYGKGAFSAAQKNKWLKDYDWFEQKTKPKGYWTYETCLKEAQKYDTLNEFHKENVHAYSVALNQGWLDKYEWLKRKIRRKDYWNYETCKEEAQKYDSKCKFHDGSRQAYNVAKANGWLNDFFEKKK